MTATIAPAQRQEQYVDHRFRALTFGRAGRPPNGFAIRAVRRATSTSRGGRRSVRLPSGALLTMVSDGVMDPMLSLSIYEGGIATPSTC